MATKMQAAFAEHFSKPLVMMEVDVKAAEARDDFEVLAEPDRRVLRVHLGAHVAAGLSTLKESIRQALA